MLEDDPLAVGPSAPPAKKEDPKPPPADDNGRGVRLTVAAITAGVGVVATGVVVFQVINRLVRGEAAEGMFQSVTDATQFFLFGVVLFGIGLLGEYIGRLVQENSRLAQFPVYEELG